jgi:hypothetical protein
MVDFGRQMDAASVNWTLLWRSRQDFFWSRSDVGSDLSWEREMTHEEEQNRGCNGSTELAMRAEQRVVQEGSSPSGARMRGAISKSGANPSLAEESRRYADV